MKIVLSRTPFGYALWQRLGLFRHGQMDESAYAIKVFRSHLKRAGISAPRGLTILELGPGDSIATAIISASYGARAILVDAGAFVRTDITPYIKLAQALRDDGLTPPEFQGCYTVMDVLASCNARYLTEGLQSLKALESGSIDLLFSQAVLEHVKHGEFLDTVKELYRLLKDGGVSSHQVDLRDHLSNGLNNLRFSNAIWESQLFSSSGFYTNRIRYSSMIECFRQAGFEVNVCDVQRWDKLPIERKKLNQEFRTIEDDDLCISVFDVLLTKNYMADINDQLIAKVDISNHASC